MTDQIYWANHLKLLHSSILAQITRTRKATNHPTLKGSSIEIILRKALADYFPLRFSIGTGQVACSSGGLSPQMDVLIYDRTTFPVLANNEDGSVVVCSESVFADVEIKTRWNHNEIQRHFGGFVEIDNRRHPYFSSPEDAASYSIVCVEPLESFKSEWSDLKDRGRLVMVTSLEGTKIWTSDWGEDDFQEILTSNPIEDLFRELLRDCMRKQFVELGNLTSTYEAVRAYFGWEPM
jgi:hypothetical protein